jgi:hypothetical protein
MRVANKEPAGAVKTVPTGSGPVSGPRSGQDGLLPTLSGPCSHLARTTQQLSAVIGQELWSQRKAPLVQGTSPRRTALPSARGPPPTGPKTRCIRDNVLH